MVTYAVADHKGYHVYGIIDYFWLNIFVHQLSQCF